MTSPNLTFDYLVSGQDGAETTVNGDLNLIDVLLQGSVKDRDLTAPPGSESDGDAYLIASGATGAWSGKDGQVAYYFSGYYYRTPTEGWRLWVDDEDKFLIYTGSAWTEIAVASTALSYGELYTDDNSGGTPQVIGTSAVQVNQWDAVGSENNMTGSVSTDDITADVGGTYLAFLSLSFSGTSSSTFVIEITKGDAGQANLRCERKLGTAGDVGSCSVSGLISLSTNDTVEVYATADGASKNFLVHEANLTLHKVG
jgi:hypothetical protein